MWHAEIVALMLRRYDVEDGYKRKIPFNGVAFVKMLGAGECFIEGALRVDGQPMTLRDWRDLGRMLRDEFGIFTIRAKRHGKTVDVNVVYDTIRL